MIIDGRSMKYGGSCENVMLQMGDYSRKTNMFSIETGGRDIVLSLNG
jgi:hypothetical protein